MLLHTYSHYLKFCLISMLTCNKAPIHVILRNKKPYHSFSFLKFLITKTVLTVLDTVFIFAIITSGSNLRRGRGIFLTKHADIQSHEVQEANRKRKESPNLETTEK